MWYIEDEYLACIIHEDFYCTFRYTAETSLTAGEFAAQSVNIPQGTGTLLFLRMSLSKQQRDRHRHRRQSQSHGLRVYVSRSLT
jgi:hypothetical protein